MKMFSVARRDGNLESAKICPKLGKSMHIKMNQVVLPKSSKIMGHGRSPSLRNWWILSWSEVNITSVLHRFMRHTFAVASDSGLNGWFFELMLDDLDRGYPYTQVTINILNILELPCSVGSIWFNIVRWRHVYDMINDEICGCHMLQADQSDSKSAGGNVFESFWWVI